jgi:ABC-type uncharacterized transport system fused permease/ATPase subunit
VLSALRRFACWASRWIRSEQQRLSMARMFFHSPTFGVLDECTSAVSVDVEESLYRSAIAQGITCITISQRLRSASDAFPRTPT